LALREFPEKPSDQNREPIMAADVRSIVLTGATRGLGRAMLARFVALGHRVAGCGTSADKVAELQRAYPDAALEVVDVVDAGAVAAWAGRVLARQGPPDLLLNNAALMNTPAQLWTIPAEEFDRVIDVNIKGVANVVRSFVPAMVGVARGVIVNFSSGWGRSTSGEVAPYCATKYAIEGLTLALAQELPRGMAAIPLNPGVIATDMLRVAFGASASSYPSPEKWAERAVPFLLRLGPRDNGKSLSV
jgi:NAD(P)-dependent dehydrogenase (short-subunit alcohol dehydrogenase family)